MGVGCGSRLGHRANHASRFELVAGGKPQYAASAISQPRTCGAGEVEAAIENWVSVVLLALTGFAQQAVLAQGADRSARRDGR